jgi:A/G-specific adenine glycosylase
MTIKRRNEPEDIGVQNTGLSVPEFRKKVLRFYRKHGRKMAWRETTDPYAILVSEIMLQQTQVERVVKKYPAFLAAFPDFGSLAKAPLADVLSAWQGLGYNRRAVALKRCAVKVINESGGELPSDPEELATFPGIGKATAGSIAAFAFNRPVVFIETNIRRVYIHCFFAGAGPVSDEEILPLARQALYRRNPRVWYWALMDLGSALKTSAGNPNRRSTRYTRQAPFEGSDRKIRGAILRAVLMDPGQETGELLSGLGIGPEQGRRIIAGLAADSLIHTSGSTIYPGK